jgi:hypothetical protein
MAIYREDLVDVELESGSIHRSFLNRSIGRMDNKGNRFGVRLFRNGQPANVDGATCNGFFMAPNGQNILITGSSYTYCGNGIAYVQLPAACYNVEGQFSLAIKVTGNGITETMRIVDGRVVNTGTDSPVAPTETVPTYEEIISVYEQMLAAKDGAVRYDIDQDLSVTQRKQARNNIGMVLIDFSHIEGDKYLMDVSTESEFVSLGNNKYSLVMHAD